MNEIELIDYNIKPSELFDWASKNIKQVRWIVGNQEKKTGCALGSVNWYLTNGQTYKLRKIKKDHPELYKKGKEWKDKNFPILFLALILNDYCFLSFKQIGNICRKLGH